MDCHICNKPIVGKYYIDSWGHKVCAIHIEEKEVLHCSTCTGFTCKTHSLVDGRFLCPVCMNSAIKRGENIDQVISLVHKNLGLVGFGDINTENIKVQIETAQFMANLRGGQINTNNKGLALSKVNSSFSLLGGNKLTMQHTIYMLEYQPRVEFAGTLAHELLHAWQVQNDITPPPKLCEGLCNLASYYIFTIMSNSLSNILIKGLMNSPDPIYGDGFREVYRMYESINWEGVIEFYRQKKY